MRHDTATPLPAPRTGCAPGTTLVELVLVLALLGVAAGVALPRLRRALDSIAVHSAVDAVAAACALARSAAIMRGALAYVSVDTAGKRVLVTVGADTLLDRPLDDGGSGRLTVSASRATIAFEATGLGYGAANTTVIARRGAAADTLVTSRLGRVRK